jgi:hypothetical protein
MHEILTLSQSHTANHLITHFYNAQDSYISYANWKDSPNDPIVHFKPTFTPTTINFTPRAFLWELNGGYGSLGKYEYSEQPRGDSHDELIQREKILKSDYQRALDQGRPTPLLKQEDISYWSDYSRVIYEPNSFNVLSNWEFDPKEYPKGRLTMGKQREFKNFDVGVEEWSHVGTEYLEDKYRVSLESCDLLNGVNIVTELDSAWGGFTSEMIKELRDDYNPKSCFITWGLYDDLELINRERLERIRAFVELQRHSSLFVPLKSMDENMWINGALQSIPFETFQTLNSEKGLNVSFHSLLESLNMGSNRHLVSNVNVINGKKRLGMNDFFKQKGSVHTFSRLKIHRPSKGMNFEKELSKERNTSEHIMKQVFPTPDSYPRDLISSHDTLTVEYSVDNSIKLGLIDMKRFVAKFVRGDERADLIDELETLAEKYEYGWADDSDEDD